MLGTPHNAGWECENEGGGREVELTVHRRGLELGICMTVLGRADACRESHVFKGQYERSRSDRLQYCLSGQFNEQRESRCFSAAEQTETMPSSRLPLL